MVLGNTTRAQRVMAGSARSVMSRTIGSRTAAARTPLSRRRVLEGSGANVQSQHILQPQFAMPAIMKREHASAAASKLGALRNDWT